MEKAHGTVDRSVDEREMRENMDAAAKRYWMLLLEIGGHLDPCFDAACGVAGVPEMVRETIADLQAEKSMLQADAERLINENTVLADRVSELEKRLGDLEEWEKIPAPESILESGYEHDLVRDQLADFALKVLQGRVGVVHREA